LAGGILGRRRHVCAFFSSIDEEHRVLHSFIKDGLTAENELPHRDPDLREDHLKRLAGAGIDVEQAWVRAAGGAAVADAYLRGNRFDQDAMLAFIEDVLQSARAGGYPLTRLLAHMGWALLDKPGVDDLIEYEIRINYVLRSTMTR